MNNDEAMAALVAQKTQVNTAINDMNRFTQEVAAGRWSATVKSRQLAAIKTAAGDGGIDISAWTGTA